MADALLSSKQSGEVRFLGGVLITNLSLGCAGFAREPAKLVDQVRFLARTLSGLLRLSDAGARWPGDCLQSSFKWVRLPPASLSGEFPMSAGAISTEILAARRSATEGGEWRDDLISSEGSIRG